MIDNIILLLTGTLHDRPIAEMLPKCHPLGSFTGMEAVTIATTVDELYSAVLVDTPVGTHQQWLLFPQIWNQNWAKLPSPTYGLKYPLLVKFEVLSFPRC